MQVNDSSDEVFQAKRNENDAGAGGATRRTGQASETGKINCVHDPHSGRLSPGVQRFNAQGIDSLREAICPARLAAAAPNVSPRSMISHLLVAQRRQMHCNTNRFNLRPLAFAEPTLTVAMSALATKQKLILRSVTSIIGVKQTSP